MWFLPDEWILICPLIIDDNFFEIMLDLLFCFFISFIFTVENRGIIATLQTLSHQFMNIYVLLLSNIYYNLLLISQSCWIIWKKILFYWYVYGNFIKYVSSIFKNHLIVVILMKLMSVQFNCSKLSLCLFVVLICVDHYVRQLCELFLYTYVLLIILKILQPTCRTISSSFVYEINYDDFYFDILFLLILFSSIAIFHWSTMGTKWTLSPVVLWLEWLLVTLCLLCQLVQIEAKCSSL